MKHIKLPSPKAVLFDWDNTLIDNWPTALHAINILMEHYGRPLYTMEGLKKRPARALRETFPALFGDEWKNAASIYYKAYRAIHLDLLTPLPHAQELLEHLHAHDIYVGVVSNKLGDNLRTEITHLRWDKYFRSIVGSKDTDFDKPSHIPVEFALSDLEHDLGPHIWFVGDTEVDMATAKNSNLTGIYVGTEVNIDLIKQTHPDITAFNNLLDIILFMQENPQLFKS